jgi:hypothetical protein
VKPVRKRKRRKRHHKCRRPATNLQKREQTTTSVTPARIRCSPVQAVSLASQDATSAMRQRHSSILSRSTRRRMVCSVKFVRKIWNGRRTSFTIGNRTSSMRFDAMNVCVASRTGSGSASI